jgi:hypothetical protein
LDTADWNQSSEKGRHRLALVHCATDLVTLAGVLLVVLLGSNIL